MGKFKKHRLPQEAPDRDMWFLWESALMIDYVCFYVDHLEDSM